MTHELKIHPDYYRDIKHHGKRFELRKDDRGFDVDDRLRLRKFDPDVRPDGRVYGYTGESLLVQITYILRDVPEYGLKPGYAILGFRLIRELFKEEERCC